MSVRRTLFSAAAARQYTAITLSNSARVCSGTGIVVRTVVMYDSRLIWREPVSTHAISALH